MQESPRIPRLGFCTTLLLIACSATAWAEPSYLCTFDELMVCGDEIGCTSEGAQDIEMSRRIMIDIGEGTLSGLDETDNLQEAKAQTIEEWDGIYFLQAVQRTRQEGRNVVGWTVFLDPNSGRISGSAVNADIVINAFGSCQQQ